MIPLWHVLAARAALALRRYRGHFPPDLAGLCATAACLLAIAYEAHGLECAIEQTGAARFGHVWVSVGETPVDITATQFGYPEFVRLRRAVPRYVRIDPRGVSAALRAQTEQETDLLGHPRRNFRTLVPALADTLGISRREARRRVRAFVGPEVRS